MINLKNTWIAHWAWPFLWILLIPVGTGLWQQSLLGGVVENCKVIDRKTVDGFFTTYTYECQTVDVLPTLLPGLLNLVAFLWVVFPGHTRYAALVAGALGAVRLLVPTLLYMASGSTLEITGDFVFEVEGSIIWSFALWCVSLVAFGAPFVIGQKAVQVSPKSGGPSVGGSDRLEF